MSLRNAVLFCLKLEIPWTAQDVATMAGTELPATKAYLAKLASHGGAVVALGDDNFRAGAKDAIRAFRAQESNAKPGGGGKAYRMAKQVRDRLLTAEGAARRQGTLLTGHSETSRDTMRQTEKPRDMHENDAGLTRAEFAQAMRATTRTIDRWIARGRVRYCLTPGGQRRIPSGELYRILTPVDAKDTP